jgi:transcription-repair coupling factor (superfamily II helicase)
MILPFVREMFADLEHSSAFERVRRHLSLGAGRRIVSGLTSTARSLYIPLMARAARQLVIVLVPDNKAAEALEPTLKAGCELTGAIDPARVVRLPAHDVLPFENLSPHPDVQEQRAAALWKLATGSVSILIAPVEAAALRLFDRDYYASLAVSVRRGEEIDVEVLTAHLASVGYTQMDLVEMPGQFTRRGGILDVYSPEMDRPVRIEFFGDEIDTIRKFDPETQRSQSGLDETQLLPLTETPVTERLLAAVHARLSKQRIEIDGDPDSEELLAQAAAAGGVSVFPGWELFAAVAGAENHLLKLVPKAVLFVDEPGMVRNQIDRWWNKVEQRHERSGIGSLIRPEDIYLRPEILQAQLEKHFGLDLDQLGAVDVLDEDNYVRRNRTQYAAHAAISRLHSRPHRATAQADGSGDAHRDRRSESGRCGAHRHHPARVPDCLPAGQPRRPQRRNDAG